jgi:hypothetical protein
MSCLRAEITHLREHQNCFFEPFGVEISDENEVLVGTARASRAI